MYFEVTDDDKKVGMAPAVGGRRTWRWSVERPDGAALGCECSLEADPLEVWRAAQKAEERVTDEAIKC